MKIKHRLAMRVGLLTPPCNTSRPKAQQNQSIALHSPCRAMVNTEGKEKVGCLFFYEETDIFSPPDMKILLK